MEHDLTKGNITIGLLKFAWPLMLGNLLQQAYNLADTYIVGQYVGNNALAAVGSSYTLMTFLTSVLIGLCMGSAAYFAIQYGRQCFDTLKKAFSLAFVLILVLTLFITLFVYWQIDLILALLQIPSAIIPLMKDYLLIIFGGILAVFIYNYFANLLRSIGDSFTPLIFLAFSAIVNIVLDLWFILGFKMGVSGAALATVIAQYLSSIGIAVYFWSRFAAYRFKLRNIEWDRSIIMQLANYSLFTCMQQSIMNLGILAVQGLVNSFGISVMTAFSAAVKIDSLAYMPVQDFGNAFSTFVAQNFGAQKTKRIKQGINSTLITVSVFCLLLSSLIFILAEDLLKIFINGQENEIISIGAAYLRIEGSFYLLIGILFMLYGYYRAIARPAMSLILTVISLGTRVLLAYVLSSLPLLNTNGIWLAVPIGWFLADLYGIVYYLKTKRPIY